MIVDSVLSTKIIFDGEYLNIEYGNCLMMSRSIYSFRMRYLRI